MPSLDRPLSGGGGANAEDVLVDFRSLCLKPASWSHAQAAAMSLAGVTALECLERAAACSERRLVLVHAGAGGVGHLQIQLARALGWRVWATAGNSDSIATCHRLGVERVINYREEDFVAVCLADAGYQGMPTIMDNVGADVFARSMEALSPLGTLVSIVPAHHPGSTVLFTKAATLIHHVMGAASLWGMDPAAQGRALSRLVGSALEHDIAPMINSRWRICDLAQAHRQIETGRTIGKVVVDVEDGW
jgi:NADPH2:quinone reductase